MGEEGDLRRLNFHSEKVPWPMIEKRLSKINWDKIFDGLNAEECTYIFIEIIKSICLELVPLKKTISKSKIPRERKMMLNRIKMLKRKKHRSKNTKDRRKIEENIIETEKILSEKRNQERSVNEKRVINNMKENPKVLFDYINKHKKKDKRIGPLKIGNDYVYDTKELCKILVEQYNSH